MCFSWDPKQVLWMRILSSFCRSRSRRAGGSSRLSLRSDAMWEFSPALGFFRLRRRERCGVMMPRTPRQRPGMRIPVFPPFPGPHGAAGAGVMEVMEAGAMQQEPLAAEPGAPSPLAPPAPAGLCLFPTASPLVFPLSRLFLASPGSSRAEGDADVRRAHLSVGQSRSWQRDPRHLGRDTATGWGAGLGHGRTSSPGKADPGLSFFGRQSLCLTRLQPPWWELRFVPPRSSEPGAEFPAGKQPGLKAPSRDCH